MLFVRRQLQTSDEGLIDFAVMVIDLLEEIPGKAAPLSKQLFRSATSTALNYGESRSAESLKDFIHKLQVVLKELRESYMALRIIYKAKLYKNEQKISPAIQECNELISIFVSSVQTASKRKKEHDIKK